MWALRKMSTHPGTPEQAPFVPIILALSMCPSSRSNVLWCAREATGRCRAGRCRPREENDISRCPHPRRSEGEPGVQRTCARHPTPPTPQRHSQGVSAPLFLAAEGTSGAQPGWPCKRHRLRVGRSVVLSSSAVPGRPGPASREPAGEEVNRGSGAERVRTGRHLCLHRGAAQEPATGGLSFMGGRARGRGYTPEHYEEEVSAKRGGRAGLRPPAWGPFP